MHYTTKRDKDLNHILNSWRLDPVMEPYERLDIERGCARMMEQFGYLPFGENETFLDDIKNTKSVKPKVFCTL